MPIEKDNIPDLNIELMEDRQGSLILLEQNSCGDTDRVAIHPIQLRYLAEKFGLVETSDPQAAKTIATLKRRLLLLNERVGYLAEFLANHSDHKHADLSFETIYARATADVSAEFCSELLETPANSAPLKSLHQSPIMPTPLKPDANTVQAPCKQF